MKTLRNESGAALIIVLGIIMLLLIFGTVLAAKMTQTQKQIDQTEGNIAARNLVRMGEKRTKIIQDKAIQAYQKELELQKAENETADPLGVLSTEINEIPIINKLDENHDYVLKIEPYPIDFKQQKSLTFKVEIQGTAYGKTVEQIKEFDFTNLLNQ